MRNTGTTYRTVAAQISWLQRLILAWAILRHKVEVVYHHEHVDDTTLHFLFEQERVHDPSARLWHIERSLSVYVPSVVELPERKLVVRPMPVGGSRVAVLRWPDTD